MSKNQTFKILVVDDSPVNLGIIKTVLSREGYTVLTASSGPEAREKASLELPDLILLDIMMPGEDGFQVIQHLKKEGATSGIPVIFLTGVSEIGSKVKGFSLGAVDYILKPFHPKEVLARVRIHLKLSVATNSLIASQAEKLKQVQQAQSDLLISPEDLPQAQFAVSFHALYEAGGDFYDVLPISDDIFGYCVADFSGHDISTSYLTASMKALLKQNCTPLYQPLESMKLINDVLVEILPTGKYLTSVYVRINKKSKQATIISSGHPPAVFVPANGPARLITLDGDILGMFKDAMFGTTTIDVKEGDRLYLYSDGLVEDEKSVWTKGALKLVEVCESFRETDLKNVTQSIQKSVFEQIDKPEDDVVLMAIEV